VKRIFAFIIGLVFALPVTANVFLHHDGQGTVTRMLAMQLESMLGQQVLVGQPLSAVTEGDIVVAIGKSSLQQACETSKGSVVAMFVGEEEFRLFEKSCRHSASAVFSGGSLDLRLGILASFWEDPAPLSLFYYEPLLSDPRAVTQYAKKHGLSLRLYPTSADNVEALKVLQRAFTDTRLTLSLYDSTLFSSEFARDAIRMSFHRQKLLAPHSAAMVKAGALFAVYSDLDAKLNWVLRAINYYQASGKLPLATYPTPLKIVFNPYLVKTYGLILPTDVYLFNKFGVCPESGCEKALY
jgi:hypothetical protein